MLFQLPCSEQEIFRHELMKCIYTQMYSILLQLSNQYTCAGPVPVFFSNEPDKTLVELKKSPEFAFDCLQALVSRLLEKGELTRYFNN